MVVKRTICLPVVDSKCAGMPALTGTVWDSVRTGRGARKVLMPATDLTDAFGLCETRDGPGERPPTGAANARGERRAACLCPDRADVNDHDLGSAFSGYAGGIPGNPPMTVTVVKVLQPSLTRPDEVSKSAACGPAGRQDNAAAACSASMHSWELMRHCGAVVTQRSAGDCPRTRACGLLERLHAFLLQRPNQNENDGAITGRGATITGAGTTTGAGA